MRRFVEELCSDRCAGRAAGTPGGAEARRLIVEALRTGGLDPDVQAVTGCNGANVLAVVPGDLDRFVLVAAHYDHLGRIGGELYAGADDNAAAVAILLEVARALAARRPDGRGVVFAAFDGEEPPNFANDTMGSQDYARAPRVPLERTDLMICMDLVGHALGTSDMPDPVRQTLFALGAERSDGTSALVDSIAGIEPGVAVRRADAETIPPLSDYLAFWEREVPFLFLTAGRWRHYHTPADTPEKLDYDKMAATARWLERLVRAACASDGVRRFDAHARDDRSTLLSLLAILDSLASSNPRAAIGRDQAAMLVAVCDREGRLPLVRRGELAMLVAALEAGLA